MGQVPDPGASESATVREGRGTYLFGEGQGTGNVSPQYHKLGCEFGKDVTGSGLIWGSRAIGRAGEGRGVN